MTNAFYLDVGSPYVYLTLARLPLDDVEWKPISLGGLWKQSGGRVVGADHRRAEGIAEIEARAERYGLAPIRWPAPWPGRYLSAMRACRSPPRRAWARSSPASRRAWASPRAATCPR